MTIRPGEPWGRAVPRPADLLVVADDAALAAALQACRDAAPGDRSVAIGLAGGDLARTLGNPGSIERPTLNELPIDLVEVTLDDRRLIACAHLVVRRPWWRGGWLRGRVVVVMNSEFLGDRDVAPRGHPDDGRVEVFEVGEAMRVRERLTAVRRARSARHVPHPHIVSRSIRRGAWSFPGPMAIIVDGRRRGRARQVDLEVVADGAVVYA